jgi:hypothetical protein
MFKNQKKFRTDGQTDTRKHEQTDKCTDRH